MQTTLINLQKTEQSDQRLIWKIEPVKRQK